MKKINWKKYDDLMHRDAVLARVYFSKLQKEYEKAFDEFIEGSKWNAEGNITASTENRVRLFTMRRKMLNASKEFVDSVIIDDYHQKLFEEGNTDIKPTTFFAQTGYQIGQVAQDMYKGLSIPTRIIVVNKLISAANHVTMKDGQSINKLFSTLNSAVNGGWNYEEIKNALHAQDFTSAHAETITRGFYSEVYQDHQNSIAETLKTEYYQLTGPPPLVGEDGHFFCQNNYGKVLKKDEWLEQAQIYSSVDAGLDPETLFVYGNGGYNCRHQLVAIAPQDVPDAKRDEAAMKKTFDKFKENYDNLNEEV